ncbi:MFS transporter [Actinomyces massiliensis]|uniref:MFS transporter n=1 Tax=Actinomyces massiliensis TaxID=461393 RepID=UPI0028F001D5|nr:MFS transporter [Actinomyces massiliensis]
MTATAGPALRRERRTLDSATLTSGTEQVVDFVLPLFAGAVLGLSAWETGLLVAASDLVAFLVRPMAGVVVDRADRAMVAALGAGVLAVGCGLYALATGLPLALIAAVVTGGAGAFLWVAIRAIIGERLRADSSVFAKLVEAEETGGWLILVPAVVLLSVAGYRWVFVGIALCCLVAAGELFRSRRQEDPSADDVALAGADLSSVSLRDLGRSLRPMLLVIVATMTAEAAISLLLILHLQRGFGLGAVEVAYIFLPGAIAMSVLPTFLHRMVVRLGRRTMLMLGSVASALFALGLAFAPSPPWIAALWVLSAVAWSLVIPVQQAVVAEAAGRAHLGRGLSLYEAACLAGAFLGSLAAGLLYESGGLFLVCIVCAIVILSGAALIPAAVNRLGVANYPEPAPESALESASADSSDLSESSKVETSMNENLRDVQGENANSENSEDSDPANSNSEANAPKPQKSRRELLTDLAAHSGLLAVALLIAWAAVPGFVLSAILGVGGGTPNIIAAVRGLFDGASDFSTVVLAALRIWFVVYVIDVIWTAWKVAEPRHG